MRAELVEARVAGRPRGRDDFEWPGEHLCGYEPDVDVISIVLHPRSKNGAWRFASDDAPTVVKKPEHCNALATSDSELIGENRLCTGRACEGDTKLAEERRELRRILEH